jgi:Cd2+/Zn2+-exporting ATPase
MPVPLANSQKTVTGAGVQTPIRILQMDCPTEEALLRKKLGDMAGVAAWSSI